MRKAGRFLLVEGYMDVLACAQAGVRGVLAPLGTALTAEQVRLLKRFAPAGLLAFDADEAGARAAQRAILLCEQADLAVEVAELAGGKDPAEILENGGAEALHKTLKCPINSFQFLLRAARARHNPGTPEGKKGIIAFLSPYLSSIDSQVKRDGYFRALGRRAGRGVRVGAGGLPEECGQDRGRGAHGRAEPGGGPDRGFLFYAGRGRAS